MLTHQAGMNAGAVRAIGGFLSQPRRQNESVSTHSEASLRVVLRVKLQLLNPQRKSGSSNSGSLNLELFERVLNEPPAGFTPVNTPSSLTLSLGF